MSAIQSVGGAEQDMGLGSLLGVVGGGVAAEHGWGVEWPRRNWTSISRAWSSMAQVARRYSGSKRAWKKRKYFGSYTMRSPRISFRRA